MIPSMNVANQESRHSRPARELGELLLRAELISEKQLREALAAQRKLRERLASILVRQGVLTEKFAVAYLGRQLGVPGTCLSRQPIELGLLHLVPLELCEKHMVFPVRIAGGRLVLAMKDPLDAKLVAEIERQRSIRLEPTVALEVSLRHTVREAQEALRAKRAKIIPDVHRALDPLPRALGVRENCHRDVIYPVLATEGETRVETLAGAELAVPTPAPGSIPSPEERERKTVLLVEADTPARAALTSVLAAGPEFKVVACATQQEALLAAAGAELAVVDASLPDGHALELCGRLRKSWPNLPLVLLVPAARGWRFARDAQAAFRLTACIEKPITAGELAARIGALLGQPAAAPAVAEAARPHLQEGMAALMREEHAAAQGAFLRGLAQDPRSGLLHYYAGLAFEKQRRDFQAMDHYEDAVRLNPELEDVLVLLAGLYERNGFRLKALETWQRALAAARDERTRGRLMAHVVDLLRADSRIGTPSRAA